MQNAAVNSVTSLLSISVYDDGFRLDHDEFIYVDSR